MAHVISELEVGGTERALSRLVRALPHEALVIQFSRGGRVREELLAAGIPVVDLGATRGFRGGFWGLVVPFLLALRLRGFCPDAVQGWGYQGNLAALAAGPALPRGVPVIWNIRSGYDERLALGHRKGASPERFDEHDLGDRSLRRLVRTSARLSGFPARTVFNSASSLRDHGRMGFDTSRGVVIPNGFDVHEFFPDDAKRREIRAALRMDPECFAVGLFSRFLPMKDHLTFCRAASTLVGKAKEVVFVLAGPGVTRDNMALQRMLRQCGIAKHTRVLGVRDEMPGLMNAVDVVTLCSAWGESFPNVLGEAMACGVPVVTTDVGGCRSVLDGHGIVVRCSSPDELYGAWLQLLALGPEARREIGRQGAERLREHFSLEAAAERYSDLYRSAARRGAGAT